MIVHTIYIHINIPMPYKQLIPKVCKRCEPKPADQQRKQRSLGLETSFASTQCIEKGDWSSVAAIDLPVGDDLYHLKDMVTLGMVDDWVYQIILVVALHW